jgi:hypothetical protein
MTLRALASPSQSKKPPKLEPKDAQASNALAPAPIPVEDAERIPDAEVIEEPRAGLGKTHQRTWASLPARPRLSAVRRTGNPGPAHGSTLHVPDLPGWGSGSVRSDRGREPGRSRETSEVERGLALHLKRGAPAEVHELAQPRAPVVDHGSAVGEQEVPEVELLEQPRAGGEQPPLGVRGIVHERVGDETERPVLPVGAAAHDTVGEHEGTRAGKMERGVIGADRVELMRDGTPRKPIPDVEAPDGLAVRELVQTGAVAVHGAAKRLRETGGLAVVVAV